jgi:hypothetical protein
VSGDICRIVNVYFFGVNSKSFVELENGDTSLSQRFGVVNLSQSMHISQKEKKFSLFFLVDKVDEGLDCSEQVSEMELFAGGFQSGENSFHRKGRERVKVVCIQDIERRRVFKSKKKRPTKP